MPAIVLKVESHGMALIDLTRRWFLRSMAAGATVPLVATTGKAAGTGHAHGGNFVVGEVDHLKNGFDPHKILTDWDVGKVTTDANGRRVREWTITAADHQFEVAPGITFAGWAYNGRIPGPTLRCTEGEQLRIHFV